MNFRTNTAANVTTETVVYMPTALTTGTVIGMNIANVTTTPSTISVMYFDGTTNVYLVKGVSLDPNDAAVILGGNQKLVVENGKSIKVVASSAVDVIVSVMEK